MSPERLSFEEEGEGQSMLKYRQLITVIMCDTCPVFSW